MANDEKKVSEETENQETAGEETTAKTETQEKVRRKHRGNCKSRSCQKLKVTEVSEEKRGS